MKTILRLKLVLVAILAFSSASAQVLFEDVTSQAGPFHRGESWGAAWGDFNGDNCPDILVNNHRHQNSLWRNDCQGGFKDVMLTFDTDRVFVSETNQDTHGSTFGDIDNDGDLDIFSARSSGGGRGQLFINNNGFGDEQGDSWGFNQCTGGRLGSFFDYDNDGDLDVFCARASYVYVYRRNAGNSFTRVESTVGMQNQCRQNNYVQFGNFNTSSNSLDLACGPAGTLPDRLFDMSTVPFTNVTSINSPNISNVNDTVFADFDNDLDVDWFALKNATRPSGASRIGNKIESWIIVDKPSGQSIADKGFTFTSSGNLTIADSDISRITNPEQVNKVYIGSSGYHPSSLPIVLDPNNTANQGTANNVTRGFFIGYNPGSGQWTAFLRSASGHQDGYFVLEGSNLSEPVMFNLDARDLPSTPRLHGNNNGTLSPSNGLGFSEAISCGSIAAGDLDNDMDIDLYLACRTGVENLENIVYWNDGDGTFTKGANHGGEGPVGAGLDSKVGSAESVVIADYDTDGFLDLFVTNGNLLVPQFVGGQDVLIRNQGGNGNHWIELDLVGGNSNRDGVGAKVTATAGGLTQLREQNGGYHRWSQDHMRIHFGLGVNTSVDITVEWPDGTSNNYNNVAADSLYKVNQGGNIVAASAGPMVDFPAPQPGDECGSQQYDSSASRAIFIYKDCGSGTWHLRAVAGNNPDDITYNGTLSSNQSINNVSGFSLEGNDVVNQPTANELEFALTMKEKGEDGIDFSLSPGASSCFNVDLPGNAQVFLGADYLLPQLPFNLETMQPCLSLSSSDVAVSEAAGVAQVDVTLLGSSTQTITVDYQTADGSASAGSDYTAGSGTLTFNPGDTVKSFTIAINNDIDIEADEVFTVGLSNASGASLATSSITVTIEDNDNAPSNCGEPVINTSVDRELFIWKDCAGNGDWHVIGTAGGGSVITYTGNFATDQAFSNITQVSIEQSDIVDTSDPQLINFQMTMGNVWRDGFNFSVAAGSTCLTLDLPVGMSVLVGENRTPVSTPFNIETLGACQSSLSVDDIVVSEADGTASVPVNLSSVSASIISVDFQTANGSATAGLDYTAGSGSVTFNPGETSKLVNIPLLQDTAIEGTETFTVQLSNSVNALISDNAGVVTINDDEISPCGEPLIDRNVDREIFIWQDCNDSTWHVRAYAGGGSVLNYTGNITTFDSFSNLVPVSIESSDVMDNAVSNVINFDMTMGSIWVDGFDFQVGVGSTCLTLVTPAGQDVLVGSGRTPATPPFDIKTLGACGAGGNNPPIVVNPGSLTNTVGANISVFISASDVDGDTLTYTQTGLPAGLDINASTGEITGTASTVGVANVTVTASDGTAQDSESFDWTIEQLPNVAPNADAGANQTIMLPATATLQGSVSDDGLPNPPGTVTTTWSLVNGPGSVTFGDAGELNTTAAFSIDGTYTLRLSADDSALNDTDDVTITVDPAPIACIDVDFETGFNGWTNLASSTCSTGSFISGTPNEIINSGVTTQVNGDHTSGSGNALYTAFNTGAGVNDVDNGECTLQSPDYSVNVASAMSIWYFHGQRDAGDDANGDYFRLEYSLNNGSSWTQMVSIGDVEQNAAWTQTSANIPANSNVRLRVAVSDGSANGDLIEAGVDDLKICPQ